MGSGRVGCADAEQTLLARAGVDAVSQWWWHRGRAWAMEEVIKQMAILIIQIKSIQKQHSKIKFVSSISETAGDHEGPAGRPNKSRGKTRLSAWGTEYNTRIKLNTTLDVKPRNETGRATWITYRDAECWRRCGVEDGVMADVEVRWTGRWGA